MTFSGKYPCPACKAIAEKKNSEQRQKALTLEKYDKKFLPPLVLPAFKLNFSTLSHPDFSVSFQSYSDSPPIPPPRSALIS